MQPAYEFSREVIDKVGPGIQVNFTRVDPKDWPGLVASGSQAVDKGFAMRKDIRALMFGDHDFDSFYRDWSDETGLFMAVTNPDFQKLNIAAEIRKKIAENDGRPELQAFWMQQLEDWQKIAVPQPPPPQPGMPGQAPGQPPQPGMGGPPQQAQGPQAPFPPGPGSVQVGAPGGISYPSVGQGPGAQGAPVGRPY
jgi:hypothetical protein